MLAFLLRLIQGNPEAHDLTREGAGITPWSLRTALTSEPPAPTGTTEALYPASHDVPCQRCRLLRDSRELRREDGLCSECITKAERKAKRDEAKRRAEERKAESRMAEAQKLVLRIDERRRG